MDLCVLFDPDLVPKFKIEIVLKDLRNRIFDQTEKEGSIFPFLFTIKPLAHLLCLFINRPVVAKVVLQILLLVVVWFIKKTVELWLCLPD